MTNHAKLFAVSLIVGTWLVKAVFVLSRPIQSLALTPYLIDDSFIFMQIARNLARGLGFTYDGMTPTTGAPPLWVWLTAPLHWLMEPASAARATVLLSAAIAGICGWLVFSATAQLFGTIAAWVALSLTLFVPALFLTSLNGMETYLFAAIGLAILVQLVLRPPTRHQAIVVGTLLGLLVWTRADGAVLMALVLVWQFLLAFEQRSRSLLKQSMLMTGISLVLLAGLLLWTWKLSGSWLPANQRGRQMIAHGYWTDWDMQTYLLQSITNVTQFVRLYSSVLGWQLGAAALVALGLVALDRNRRSAMVPFVLYTLFLISAYAFYQWYFPDVHGLRYILFSALVMMILMAGGIAWLGEQWRVRILIPAALTLLLLLIAGINYYLMVNSLSWTQVHWIAGVPDEELPEAWCVEDWITYRLPKDAVIAAKDHGRLAYFGGRRIVDLAGIIDPAAIDSIRERNMLPYLTERGATHVILYRNHDYYLNSAFDLLGGPYDKVNDFCPSSHFELYKIKNDEPN